MRTLYYPPTSSSSFGPEDQVFESREEREKEEQDDDDHDGLAPATDSDNDSSDSHSDNSLRELVQRHWGQRLRKETKQTQELPDDLVKALDSILILEQQQDHSGSGSNNSSTKNNNSDSRIAEFLRQYQGQLFSLLNHNDNDDDEYQPQQQHLEQLLQYLRRAAPKQYAARVADFNDNLWFAMQEQRGLNHLSPTNTTTNNKSSQSSSSSAAAAAHLYSCDHYECDETKQQPQQQPQQQQQQRNQTPVSFETCLEQFEQILYQSITAACRRSTSSAVSADSDSADTAVSVSAVLDYQSSFLSTETTIPQPPHVDYTWQVLQERGDELFIALMPLTPDGMFLQVWPSSSKAELLKQQQQQQQQQQQEKEKKESLTTTSLVTGQIVYVPYGTVLLLPSTVIHGGGFKKQLQQHSHQQQQHADRTKISSSSSSSSSSSDTGNLRLHLYLARPSTTLPTFQTNTYTLPNNKRYELSDTYVDAPYLTELCDYFFDS